MRAQESKAGSPSSTVKADEGDVSRIGRTEDNSNVTSQDGRCEKMRKRGSNIDQKEKHVPTLRKFSHLFSAAAFNEMSL